MLNFKKIVSLLLAIATLAIVAMPVMAATTEVNIPVTATVTDKSGSSLSTSKTYTNIMPGDVITVTASCMDERSVRWSSDAEHAASRGLKVNSKGMAILAYMWDSTDVSNAVISDDPTSVRITVPNFDAGTSHTLLVQAVGAIDHYVLDGVTYIATTGWMKFKINIPGGSTTPVDPSSDITADTVLTYNGRVVSTTETLKVKVGDELVLKAVTNGEVRVLGYQWDNLAARGGSLSSYTLPIISDFVAGSTHRLQTQVVTMEGVKSVKKDYTVMVVEDEVTPTPTAKPTAIPEDPDEPEDYDDDDELIIEPWMLEEDGLTGLAVSLRNDSEEDKANKNIYALNEEVIYYVDYKNGGRKTSKTVTLVLNVPETFKVVKSDGGTVSTKKGTITWTFKGLDEDEAGTKTVVLKYTSIGAKKVTCKYVKPLAEIKLDSKVKDTSAVINLIYKDSDTEIKDTHYPYMFGDKDEPTFRPDDGITRGEAALVLTRTLGISTAYDTSKYNYPDLDETYLEARKAIVAATAYGLVQGYPDGTYRPNENISRSEFMTVLANAISEDNGDGFEIKDSSSSIKRYKNSTRAYVLRNSIEDEHWAIDEVTLLTRLNMTPVSDSNRNLRLDDTITRAEVAQLMNFFLFRAPAEVTSKTKSGFIDVAKKHKLFADIIEATRDAHTYYITDDTTEVLD